MAWAKTMWDEFYGLFVDDGSLAVAVLAWLAVCWLILPRLGVTSLWHSALLFTGLVVILAESALRRARQRR